MKNLNAGSSKKQGKCLICHGIRLVPYFDLGCTALANSFVKKSELGKKEKRFPLAVLYCKNCHLVQLSEPVDKKVLFSKYAFFSSASSPLEEYFKRYVDNLKSGFPIHVKRFVVEIGSNDGILLKNFDKSNTRVLGIDPAKNVAKVAIANGVETLPIFFSTKNARKIVKHYRKASMIIANHVLAHTDNLDDIIGGIKILMEDDGIFVFEVQYIANLLSKNQFDNTYHEHVSYFSLAPLTTLFERYSMQIFNVEETEAQGGSIRVFVANKPSIFIENKNVKRLLKKEEVQGLYTLRTYKEFSKKPKIVRKELVLLLHKLKKQGKKIAGYGASAKGNTLLQYSGIDNTLVDYIVDTTPSKQGKYTPGTHIPIYNPEHLIKDTPDYILILAWNYADVILKKENILREKGVKFIVPIPKVQIL